eukprot:scaffold81837_cov67-Phaeocystis_antarctica.AAC.1
MFRSPAFPPNLNAPWDRGWWPRGTPSHRRRPLHRRRHRSHTRGGHTGCTAVRAEWRAALLLDVVLHRLERAAGAATAAAGHRGHVGLPARVASAALLRPVGRGQHDVRRGAGKSDELAHHSALQRDASAGRTARRAAAAQAAHAAQRACVPARRRRRRAGGAAVERGLIRRERDLAARARRGAGCGGVCRVVQGALQAPLRRPARALRAPRPRAARLLVAHHRHSHTRRGHGGGAGRGARRRGGAAGAAVGLPVPEGAVRPRLQLPHRPRHLAHPPALHLHRDHTR